MFRKVPQPHPHPKDQSGDGGSRSVVLLELQPNRGCLADMRSFKVPPKINLPAAATCDFHNVVLSFLLCLHLLFPNGQLIVLPPCDRTACTNVTAAQHGLWRPEVSLCEVGCDILEGGVASSRGLNLHPTDSKHPNLAVNAWCSTPSDT